MKSSKQSHPYRVDPSISNRRRVLSRTLKSNISRSYGEHNFDLRWPRFVFFSPRARKSDFPYPIRVARRETRGSLWETISRLQPQFLSALMTRRSHDDGTRRKNEKEKEGEKKRSKRTPGEGNSGRNFISIRRRRIDRIVRRTLNDDLLSSNQVPVPAVRFHRKNLSRTVSLNVISVTIDYSWKFLFFFVEFKP